EKMVGTDPFALFMSWFGAAQEAGIPLPEAMALATAGEDGGPSVRMVLMKECTPQGVVSCTNYQSGKGRQLRDNPRAAAVFHGASLQRQVRVEGLVKKSSEEDSDRYFSSRPRKSQLAAWASDQSRVIPDRAGLEQRFGEFSKRWAEAPPRPIYWGGY